MHLLGDIKFMKNLLLVCFLMTVARSSHADCSIVSVGSWEQVTMNLAVNDKIVAQVKYDPLDRAGTRTQSKAYLRISGHLIGLVKANKCSSGNVVETFWFSDKTFTWFGEADSKADRLEDLVELNSIYDRNSKK